MSSSRLTVGPWILNWETQQYKCWIAQPIVFGLIFALQLVNLYWLFLILRIIYRMVTTNVAVDDRSDDEDEELEEVEDEIVSEKQSESVDAADKPVANGKVEVQVNGEVQVDGEKKSS
ncbi:unnamed protein product [Ambrosiozyma monospora]|uniref:Unnamed protein product n=1 Tax=Ambrosiozyma monospora TaxID=43982 RepID=A0A9W6T698_AMBMO|nr:unnamed protein product [Ambrosiozyma monospora]